MAVKSAANEKNKVKEEPVDAGSPYALLFELEGVAIEARKAEFEVLQSLLREQHVKVTPFHFVKHCLNTSPLQYLPVLLEQLGSRKISAEKLAGEINSGMALYLASREAALKPSLKKILSAAAERDMPVAMLTSIKASTAESLMTQLGMKEWNVRLFDFEQADRIFPRADCWLKIAKALSRTPRQCLAVAGSMISTKAALSAGMRCVAVPDEFTVFQDYSGADMVLESDADFNARELLDLLCPLEIPFTRA